MVNPELLKWARERAELSLEEAVKKIASRKYPDWEEGKSQPTEKQIKKIAEKFYVPYGYLFLSEPPKEELPIPDFRTINNKELEKPGINLLETIYDSQRKQNWLREQKIQDGEDKIFSYKYTGEKEIITEIKRLLDIDKLRSESRTQEDFLSNLIKKLDDKEFLIIRNGVVGSNTSRGLDREEFKGFCLFDEYAPAIFINGRDYKSSQIFTLIHELAHLFLNESALDGTYHLQTEKTCNKIASEILLPAKELKKEYFNIDNIEGIAKKFKISVFVVLIKAKQSSLIREYEFQRQWKDCIENIQRIKSKGSGGDYYRTAPFKAGGETFLLRVVHSTLAGETLYRDAYSLTGLKGETFNKYYRQLGLPL